MERVTQHNRPVSVRLPAYGITAFTSRHGAAFRMPAARHAYHKVAVVVAGNGRLDVGGEAVALAEGDAVRVSAGAAHRFVDAPGAPMTLSVLCIDDAATRTLPMAIWADVARSIGERRASRIGLASAGEARRVARQIAIEAVGGAPYAAAVVAAHATQFLARVLRAARDARRRDPIDHDAFDETFRWLERHFTERVQIADLAARSAMSYRSFTAAFRARAGASVVPFVTARRLTLAERLIRETGDIATSAFESGFGDVSHFYRAYAARFGRTPGGRRLRRA